MSLHRREGTAAQNCGSFESILSKDHVQSALVYCMIRVLLISTLQVKGSKERKWEGEVHKILARRAESAVAKGSNCVLGLRTLLSYSILGNYIALE